MAENDEKLKIMSIAVQPELHNELKSYTKKKGVSASAYIRQLLEKAVKLNLDHDPLVVGVPTGDIDTHRPIVLLVPKDLRDKPEELKTWLYNQADKLHQALVK